MIKDSLLQCGYPTTTLVLDAETYFDQDYSLSKLSTYEYVADDRFEILGWAVKYEDQPSHFIGDIANLRDDWKNFTIVMHNAPFDALILAMKYGIYLPFIIDTLDLARHVEPRWGNALAALCERYGLPAKGDTKQFKGLHHGDFTDDQWVALKEYATNDAEREYDLLGLLLPKLSNPAFELRIAEYTRNLFIKPTLHFSMSRSVDLEEQMEAEIQKALKQVDTTEKIIRSEAGFKALLVEGFDGDVRELPMKQGKLKPLLAIAKTDPGYNYLLTHPNKRIRQLMEARVASKSWPMHIKRVGKLGAMFKAAGDRMPIPLKYCGAHTGRWSGNEGINTQNFTARGHVLANQVRTLIEAPKGFVLIIMDQSQIEARILDWLAEQNDMLRAFAEGRQIYCEFASKLTGHRIRKPKKTDGKVVAEWYGSYRQMGKIGILGAGYGMGVDRCLEYAKNTYHIDLTHAEAERIIKLYRRTHAMVVLFWNKIEKAFRLATQNPGQAYELAHGLRFMREDDATVIQLPSTRRLYYTRAKIEGTTRNPQITMPNPAKDGPHTIRMWGGYLAENIVQATSRDTLAEVILKVEALGLRVPMTVHDDISVVVPEDQVELWKPQIED
ncbi:hypothetical protein LCGC14_1737230, partial [marine sediment metagenome]